MRRKVMAMVMAAMTMAAAMAVPAMADEESVTIGISQFAEHGSLDNCREGFLEGLKEAGYEEGKNLTIEYQNAQADTGNAATIADSFVNKKVDLICAIATPSAMSAYNSAMDADIPVIYTAVSDPSGAGLVNEDGTNVGNITGTSDKLPVTEQMALIRELMPDAKKIGILYTTSEANSVSALAKYDDLAGDYGFEIVEKGISQTADISLAADELLGEVDCLTNLTDNTVVASLATILDKANAKKIPVFGSEIEQVKIGCLAAEGLDYVALGKQTGKMAAKILKGEKKASDMQFETITEPGFYVNNEVAKNLGITVPEDLQDKAVESFDEITK